MSQWWGQTQHQRKYTDGNKHIKRHSAWFAIRKMQNQITVRYHYTTVRVIKIKYTEKTNLINLESVVLEAFNHYSTTGRNAKMLQ